MRFMPVASLLSIVCLVAMPAQAQTYPAKAVRLIIPFSPGGATDLLGRLVAQSLSDRLGQPVVPENRTGGGGNIGAEFTTKAPADGYTIMVAGIPHAINMSLYKKINYNLATDLTPITNLATFPSMIAVHPSLPAKTMKELIALGRAQPGALNYGASPGSPNHLVMELISVMTGVKMVHISYKGSGPGIIDLIGGHLHVSSIGFPGAMPHVKSGRLRPIAVTSAKRSTLLPDLPTIAESAIPGFDVNSWYGIFAPPRLPDELVSRLNTEIRALMNNDDMKAKLAAAGAEVDTNSAQDFAKLVRAEIDRWAKVVKASGATVN
jgi:tripartite-type tricarboxylate transporter receptor subunit TctC